MTCQVPGVINHWRIITQSDEKSAWNCNLCSIRNRKGCRMHGGVGGIRDPRVIRNRSVTPSPTPPLPSDPNSLRECPVDPCTTSYPVALQTTTFCQLHCNQWTFVFKISLVDWRVYWDDLYIDFFPQISSWPEQIWLVKIIWRNLTKVNENFSLLDQLAKVDLMTSEKLTKVDLSKVDPLLVKHWSDQPAVLSTFLFYLTWPMSQSWLADIRRVDQSWQVDQINLKTWW